MKIAFNDSQLEVVATNDSKQWYLTVEEVAKGYGVVRTTVMNHLKEHRDDLKEGVEHGGVSIADTTGRVQFKTVIYREGVIKLGFFIRSKQAVTFRQWATQLIIKHMDEKGMTVQDMFEKINDRMDTIEHVCSGLRDEVDELKEIVGMLLSDETEIEIRLLVKRIKFEKKIDGRTIIGHVRKTLNIGSVYEGSNIKQVINVLKNLLGEGIKLVKDIEIIK